MSKDYLATFSGGSELIHANGERTVRDVISSMTPEQRTAMDILVADAIERQVSGSKQVQKSLDRGSDLRQDGFDVTTDYLAHYGIKGMKWGIRRSRSELKGGSSNKEGSSEKKTSGSTSSKGNIQDNVESSQARYNRLKDVAKSGRANTMTEQDLKFFNARTEALAKIKKMNEVDPSWLSKTTKKVLKTAAENAMQNIANGLTAEYISGPILEGLKSKK